MNPYRCYYHPEIEAVTKCERCGKYLCLECKQVSNRMIGGTHGRATIRRELCPECYDKTISYNIIMFIVFFIIFIIALVIILQNFRNFTNQQHSLLPFG